MDGIDLNGGRDVKTGGLKTEAETSGSRKKINSDRSHDTSPFCEPQASNSYTIISIYQSSPDVNHLYLYS